MATYTEIHLRRDSTLNWYATNPRLALGEPGIDLTLHRFKIGNGIDRWNQLPYMDDDLYKLLDKQQQETADKVKDLLNKIAANKLDADTKHNALTTEVRNTSRDLNARMTAVETEQEDYETELTRRQSDYEKGLTQRQEVYEEGLTDEFTETKAEVHAGLEEFNETRDQLATRMDVIAGQTTEDTEVLDARVDALSQAHPNLGANIRNVHGEVLINRAQIAGLKATDELHESELTAQVDRDLKLSEHGEYLQEQLDTTAEGLLKTEIILAGELAHSAKQDDEISELKAGLEAEENTREELRKDFEHEAQSRQIRDEDLASQVDDLSEAVLGGQLYAVNLSESLQAESLARDAAVENVGEVSELRSEHLQEQVDENAQTLIQESLRRVRDKSEVQEQIQSEQTERVKADDQLRQDIGTIAAQSLEHREHLQEQSDETAITLIQDILARHTDKQELQSEIVSAENRSNLRDEHLQEQVDENAESVLKLSVYLKDALKEQKSPVNWSRAESLAIPEPRCAVVNFTGIDAMPTSKTADTPAVIEFWDMHGNYFRKSIVCSAQGNSSLAYVKKNVKIDLLNEDGSEFELKIGNWVSQDGYHLKAYYTDFFRGVAVASYKVWDEIMRYNGLANDRPYKRVLIKAASIQTSGTKLNNPDDVTLQLDNGALCHPDGFPCVVYLNGEFYGIFAWQIKKQRKNYHMEKGTVTHIHLDGDLTTANFWDGVIKWSAFEIRNPNKLYTMDGKKYDGDAPRELIDATSEKYDPDNKDHVRSATVKKYIQDFVRRFNELKAAPSRVKYEEIFDWENQRDYLIFGDVVKNSDGFHKNWQWTTYDGVKWYVNAYDLDMSYGGHWQGIQITPPLTNHITTSTAIPTGYVPTLYRSELETRYKELRDAGIISVSNILSKLEDWTARIGTGNYELEYQRWPSSPCIVNYTDSIYRVKKWLETEIVNMDRLYNYIAFTLKDMQEVHESDMKALRNEVAGASNLRQVYVEGLQEQIDQLAELRLVQIIKDYEDSKARQAEAERERIKQQEQAAEIRGMFDEISEAVLRSILYDKQERETLAVRLDTVEEALTENEILSPASASLMTNTEVNNMIDNVLSGDDTAGIEAIDEDEQEIFDMFDDVFDGTDTDTYEDEVTEDLDTIFNP